MMTAIVNEASTSVALQTALENDSGLRAFALLDGALLLSMPKPQRKAWLPVNGRSLLARAEHDAAAVGPLLFELTRDQLANNKPDTLLDFLNGQSAGSFILSQLDAASLAHRLQNLLDVLLDDGSDMLMRFFDPRVLPFWLAILEPSYQTYVAQTMQQWMYWGADFSLQTQVFTPHAQEEMAAKFPMQISSKQEQTLLDACAPWTMIERFRSESVSALASLPVSQRYAFFAQQLQRAQAYGLQGQGDLEAYCSLAIECSPLFDEDKAMSAALASVKNGTSFTVAVATLTDIDWKRMRVGL